MNTPEGLYRFNFDRALQGDEVVTRDGNAVRNFSIRRGGVISPSEGRTNLKYRVFDDLSLDVQFLYFGDGKRLNVEIENRKFLNFAARYKVFDGKGSVNLRFTDVFKGNVFRSKRYSNEIIEDMKWMGQTRVGILSFSYRFARGDIKKRKAREKRYNESGALE